MSNKISNFKNCSIIIDDDNKTVYAYLLQNQEIKGDVWLFNYNTPNTSNWKDPSNMPFENPKEFVNIKKHNNAFLLYKEGTFKVIWEEGDHLENRIQATIFIDEELIALISPGSSPGWSTLVKKDGPLARIYMS